MTNKAMIRAEIQESVADYLEAGGEVHTVDASQRGRDGLSWRDWKRLAQGLKVATKEEIEAERDRRALVALRNTDHELVIKILTGTFDREIKFDIENDRIGPNGEIR